MKTLLFVFSVIFAYSTLYCVTCVPSVKECPDPVIYDLYTVKLVLHNTFESMRCGLALMILTIVEILEGITLFLQNKITYVFQNIGLQPFRFFHHDFDLHVEHLSRMLSFLAKEQP